MELTADQLVVAAVFDSGEHAQDPAALAGAFAAGQIDPVVLSVVLPWVWRYKLDACTLPVGAWREMFAAVPYAVNGRATDRPRWARRLYRGATEDNREGLSWTAHLDVAGYFAAHRQAPHAMGRVWTAVVVPMSTPATWPCTRSTRLSLGVGGLRDCLASARGPRPDSDRPAGSDLTPARRPSS